VSGLVCDGYESACTTSVVIATFPSFGLWRINICILITVRIPQICSPRLTCGQNYQRTCKTASINNRCTTL